MHNFSILKGENSFFTLMLVNFHIKNEILEDCLIYQNSLFHFIVISTENVP